jgi:hypothetical protein
VLYRTTLILQMSSTPESSPRHSFESDTSYEWPREEYTMPAGTSAYLWLAWFQSPIPEAPKRWMLVVSYDPTEDAFGTGYHVSSFTITESYL